MDRTNQHIDVSDMEMEVRQALEGDLDAFNQLVLKYQNLAYGQAHSMLNDEWLAEEVVQESFLKAFQSMHSFRGGSFRAWLMRIVSNTAYDVLRRSAKRPTQPLFPENEDGEEMESPYWMADPNTFVESTVERNEEEALVYRALSELPDHYRNVLILIDLQDFDYVEASQALNVPIGTVKSRLARARMQMKEKLGNSLHALAKCRSLLEIV